MSIAIKSTINKMTKDSQKYNVNSKSDMISLKEFILKILEWWRFLLSKWVVILTFGIVGGLLGFYYATTKKTIFIATTTFVLEDEKAGGGLGNLAGLASMAGVDLGNSGGSIFQGDNIIELYKSRKMIVQTLLTEIESYGKRQLLINRYIDFNKLRSKWEDQPELMNLQFSVDSVQSGNPVLKPNRLRDSVLNGIVEDIAKNYLMVGKPDKKLSIIKVDVKARDEVFSKTFNDAIVKNVNDFYLRTKTKKSLQNVQIMQQKTDSVRAVMNNSIYTAVAVADATPNLNLTRQVKRIAPSQKAQFSAETNKAVLSSLIQNLEMSKLALMKETPLLEVLDQPNYPLTKERFGKLKGLILGGLIFGFLSIMFLTLRNIFKTILS